ncbi:MAG: short-chain dehydrogenase, partial [Mesorhizobium sp.]
MTSTSLTESATEQAASRQRSVQRKVDATDRAMPKGKSKSQGAMQAGARQYPAPPFPKQHHPKPGEEWAIDPAPLYDAPFWQGSGKLAGKVALITG